MVANPLVNRISQIVNSGRPSSIVYRIILFLFFAFTPWRQALALDITLDGAREGRVFEGIGGVSASASSRLLVEYPEPQRSQILDYLFKPHYGASLQHLKVEIGGEVNSTDGTEPSHEPSRGHFDFTRGYEWWLMQQAKARNPNMSLDCLAWGAPGWIGNGNYCSQDMCDYIVSFIKGAQTTYGLTFDFTGTHNEAPLSPAVTAWIKQLRATLDANGLRRVGLVAADEWGGAWAIVTNSTYDIFTDPALSNAVARIGAHYPHSRSPQTAKACGLPLWASEDGGGGSTWWRARRLGRIFNRNYVLGRMTATEVWSLITSYYDILPARDAGLMRANTPWSGNYDVAPAIWVTAHTTQFASPGWRYLEGGASAMLPDGSSIVTFKSTNGSDYSIVVETFGADDPQTITFHLTNGLSTAAIHLWQTSEDIQFANVGQITPTNGTFTCTFQPECIYSITTTTGQAKGDAVPPPPAPFPLPYKDDFQSYAPGQVPKYFMDQAGVFEIFDRVSEDPGAENKTSVGRASPRAVSDPGSQTPDPISGRDLRQLLTHHGIRWTSEWQPYTLIGDPDWSDYDVSADVLIETNCGLAFVMGRAGEMPGFSDALPRAYWLALSYVSPSSSSGRDGALRRPSSSYCGQWELYASSNLLASGPCPSPAGAGEGAPTSVAGAGEGMVAKNKIGVKGENMDDAPSPGSWHNLRLAMQGVSLKCYVDGILVTNLMDSTYTAGLAGIGCGWHRAQFANFNIHPLAIRSSARERALTALSP